MQRSAVGTHTPRSEALVGFDWVGQMERFLREFDGSIPTWSEGSLAGTPGVSVVNPKVRSKRLIEDVNINHQHELSLQCGMNQRSWSPIAGGIYIEHFFLLRHPSASVPLLKCLSGHAHFQSVKPWGPM